MADRYIDNTKESGTLTGPNWQCTNGSGTVTDGTAINRRVSIVTKGWYDVYEGSRSDVLLHTTTATRRTHALTATRRTHAPTATRRDHDIDINE